jgi:hypothetical protein
LHGIIAGGEWALNRAYFIEPPLAAEAARPNVFSRLETAVVKRS